MEFFLNLFSYGNILRDTENLKGRVIDHLHLVLGTFLEIQSLLFLDEHDLGELLYCLYTSQHRFLHYVTLASPLNRQISRRGVENGLWGQKQGLQREEGSPLRDRRALLQTAAVSRNSPKFKVRLCPDSALTDSIKCLKTVSPHKFLSINIIILLNLSILLSLCPYLLELEVWKTQSQSLS